MAATLAPFHMEIQDRYEIRRKLGQGGVGAVYEGFDHQLRRRVAVKRLLETKEARSEEAVAELLKECHSLSALNSPNIVQLFDFGKDSDGPFVVMELLEGETLEELINKAPFTEADFTVLAEQSLEGLLAAHQAHLLHRDLKPCNFMVTWLPSGRMQLKILDFGLAKFSVEPSKQTIAHGNSLFGSIYFMAPEQFEQLPLDDRTDLYALGTVFYYALAGTYPFNGESVAQVMASHLTGQYKDLRDYRPDLNPAICKWIMSLMARKPEQRPESCAIALAQFMGIQNGTFTPQEPPRVAPSSDPLPIPDSTSPPVPTQTKTVSLLLPGAERNTGPVRLHTGRVTLHTGAVPAPGQPPTITTAVPLRHRPPEHTGAIHVQAPVAQTPPQSAVTPPSNLTQAVNITPQAEPTQIFGPPPEPEEKSKLLLYIVLLACFILAGLAIFFYLQEEPDTDDPNPKQSLVESLPSGEELIRLLSLPPTPDSLITRRDKNEDGKLTLEEFVVAPTEEREKRLMRYFSLIDEDSDGALSLNELDRAYQRTE